MNALSLLPRARIGDVLRGRAALVGARLDPRAPRGWVSPVEARVAAGLAYGDLAREEQRYLSNRTLWRDAGTLVRLLIATILSLGGSRSSQRRPFVVSARVDNISAEEALAWVFSSPDPRASRFGFFVHPHALNLAAFDPALRAALARGDVVLPDGIGLRIGSRLLGAALSHNVNGTDLLPLLCARAVGEGVPLVLVGAAPGVAEECARRLRHDHESLEIPIVSDGFMDDAGARALVGRIRALGRAVVLVGMGTPRQERWALDHLAALPQVTVLTVGGLFDFYSGRVPRAPLAWRELGLEWLYRLCREPRRLARRYLLGNPLFIALVLAQRFSFRRLDLEQRP